TKAGTYTEYVSKGGATVKVGDSLQINNPSNFERYMYITQNDAYLRADNMNKKLKLKAINVSGDDKKGYTVFLPGKVWVQHQFLFDTKKLYKQTKLNC